MKKKKKQYEVVQNKRSGLYGVKKRGVKGWWIAPEYEAILHGDIESSFKKNGRFGLMNIETREILIEAKYGYPLYFYHDLAEAWLDYKAGIINRKDEVIVPIIYDEIHLRQEWVENENQKTIILDDGTEQTVGPDHVIAFRGYACFTNDGVEQAYDEYGQPCEFADWEQELLNPEIDWCIPENKERSVEEIEAIIKDEYRKLIGMGYNEKRTCRFTREQDQRLEEQSQLVINLLADRSNKMNAAWLHNYENGCRFKRVNDLLMRAVRKAIRLGGKAARSLQWMEKVTNQTDYEVEICVSPYWENDRSCYDYTPKFKNAAKERERLEDQQFEERDLHIYNIIDNMHRYGRHCEPGACFDYSSVKYEAKEWEERELFLDDGQSWTEGIHYPAYMDCHFLYPFHKLYLDNFVYSNEDIDNINDFRVHVEVHLETKEQSKRK